MKKRFRRKRLGDRKRRVGTKRRTTTNKRGSILLTPAQV
jgi:hypothetical protein